MKRAYGTRKGIGFFKAVGLIHIVGMDFNPSTRKKKVESRRFGAYNRLFEIRYIDSIL
jgi:hypothetical protein